MSIPRLELSAVVLLSKLVRFVQLFWLKQHLSRWKTFIANRVSEIHSNLPTASWRHVPTRDNPADCASRRLLGKELVTYDLWWKGPTWLKLSPENCPTDVTATHSAADLECRVTVHTAVPQPEWDLGSKFFSWSTLIRVTVYVIRFVTCCRMNKSALTNAHVKVPPLPPKNASLFWLKTIQFTLFPNKITALRNQNQISKKSSILALHPFLDTDNLLRVGDRLKNALIPFNTKYPIILAAHPLVMLIIRQAHLRTLHAGLQLTLTTLRQEFWIVRARTLIKSVLCTCVTCSRENARSPHQLMGNLPARRVTPSSRSFLHYAGPVQIRSSSNRGVKSKKAYIALFICLSSRAIHLELVGDYSTAAFLDAFSRFCARRGLPESMYSDNGTTFVGADKELQRAYYAALHNKDFLNTTASDNINWHFLPPSAPYFGGLWEAGVRSVKYHLRRILKEHTLTFEEFTTLLCRIEACLNSRPLAPLKDTPDDYETLTPRHFLIGSALNINPEPSLLNLNENRLSRWQRVRQLTERFWKLWQNDYVNTLQQRVKWKTLQPSVKIGQLVLLKNSTLPCKWELGQIIQCHAGSDGLIRVVTVKTAASEFKRPIVKICLLPINMDTNF